MAIQQVLFDDERFEVSSLEELRHYLQQALERDHAEIWLNHNHPPFKSMALLTNRRYQRAYVETNEAQSYDPDYTGEDVEADLREALGEDYIGDEETTVDFVLSNGQEDDIVVSRTAHLPYAVTAFEEFFQTSTLSSAIQWERNRTIEEIVAAIDTARENKPSS